MTSTTGPSPDRRQAGAFTLLELILVLVLISTVLAIAAPSLRGFVRGRQTANAAAQLLALTHLARSQAVTRGCIHRLNIDAEEGTYWLTMQQAGAFVETDSDHGRRYELPTGVLIALDRAQGEEQSAYVEFFPDGRCDPATIELTGGEGDALRVTCSSPSERFRIVSLAEEQRR